MEGGNLPGKTQTISIDIYDKVQALDLATANTTALALLVFSFPGSGDCVWSQPQLECTLKMATLKGN